ncbi:hypothetical protein GOP47_0009443, partial [Adiantum capillus-veneris]
IVGGISDSDDEDEDDDEGDSPPQFKFRLKAVGMKAVGVGGCGGHRKLFSGFEAWFVNCEGGGDGGGNACYTCDKSGHFSPDFLEQSGYRCTNVFSPHHGCYYVSFVILLLVEAESECLMLAGLHWWLPVHWIKIARSRPSC